MFTGQTFLSKELIKKGEQAAELKLKDIHKAVRRIHRKKILTWPLRINRGHTAANVMSSEFTGAG